MNHEEHEEHEGKAKPIQVLSYGGTGSRLLLVLRFASFLFVFVFFVFFVVQSLDLQDRE